MKKRKDRRKKGKWEERKKKLEASIVKTKTKNKEEKI